MKIVVAYKWAPNPQDAEVRPDGTIDWSRARSAISEYDLVAFELARRLAEATGGEVIGVTVGGAAGNTPLAHKAALSRGLDRLVMVADERLADLDGTRLAVVLAGVVITIGGVDLVFAGESSVDVAEGQVAMTLAGQLGWLGLASVSSADAVDGVVTVTRELPSRMETLALTGPAVLATTADAAAPRTPGMKDILAATKKPVTVLTLVDIGRPSSAAEVVTLSTAKPDTGSRQRVIIDGTDPDAAAAALLAALREGGIRLPTHCP